MIKNLLLLLFLTGLATISYGQCGLDIFIVNDQSGSVDATENILSRNLVLKIGEALPLGTGNAESRMAISDWSNSQQQYIFPAAGANYTTSMSDIISYKNALRTFYGGTNTYGALLNAYNLINQTPVTGRTARKLIVLMTDADPGQIQNNLVELANQVRTSGIVIAVVAVGNASIQQILQDDRVASSASLYFGYPSYADMMANANQVVSGLLTNACSATLLQPNFDLSIQLNSGDCSAGQVNYTVTNKNYIDFSSTLSVSFYDNDPATVPSAKLLATDARPGEVITGGASQNYTFTDPALSGKSYVYAVVNLSTAGSNATPLLPYNLTPRLLVTGEQNPFNNRSFKMFLTPCDIPKPRLEVSNKFLGMGCDSTLRYQVTICNTGAAAANSVIPQLVPGSNNLVLQNVTDNSYPSFSAQYAYPGGNTTDSSYNCFTVGQFPTATVQDTPYSKLSVTYYTTGSAFMTTAGYVFPPVSGQGVPYGAQIISARLKIAGATGTSVVGYKTANADKWDPLMYPGLARAEHATANLVNKNTSTFDWVDVSPIAQELVNQPGWTSNSAMGFIWHGGRVFIPNTFDNPDPALRPQLEVTYLVSNTIASGECATYTYILKDTVGTPATYDASVGVTTSTAGAEILPNTNFTTNGVSGLNGYDGAAAGNTMDNATMPAGGTGCTQKSQPITTSVVISPTSSCSGSYVTATVTINNPNTQPVPGIHFYNLTQYLNITGTGASFAGEPYGVTNGLKLTQPDVMDPAYPAVPNALNGKGGNQSLRILELPAGTSTFKIDLAAGTANFNLQYTIDDIPSNYNAGGITNMSSDATGVTINPAPGATWSCPGAVTAGANISLSATTTGASSVFMQSATGGAITNTGSVAVPAATYTPTAADQANGYAAFTITALSSQGCDAAYSCQVPITAVAYDFGDAPASYDLNATTPDIAGSATVRSGLYLGALAPGTETNPKSSANADGDGAEEDGLVNTLPASGGAHMATYQVRVTNNTVSPACLTGFVDHNGNGSLVDSFDRSAVVNIPAGSGEAVYTITFSNVPVTGVPPTSFMRLRLSTVADAAANAYGASPEGEVEDYLVQTMAILPIHLTSFTADAGACRVTVNWKVESAENFSRFIVERSSNGLTYVNAATLYYLPGQNTYTWNDVPGTGKWLYRLKLVDNDGAREFSKTALVQVNCNEGQIKIRPTVTTGLVTVQLSKQSEQAKLIVLNSTGQRMHVPVKGGSMMRELNLQRLAAGYYIIQVVTGAEVQTFGVIKQ